MYSVHVEVCSVGEPHHLLPGTSSGAVLGNTCVAMLRFTFFSDRDHFLLVFVQVARDKSGVPDVLLRLEIPVMDSSADVIVPEYMS